MEYCGIKDPLLLSKETMPETLRLRSRAVFLPDRLRMGCCCLVPVYYGICDKDIVQCFLVRSPYGFVNGSDNRLFGPVASVTAHVDAKRVEGRTEMLKTFGQTREET